MNDFSENNQNLLSQKAINIWRIRATLILIAFSFVDGGIFVFLPLFSLIFAFGVLIIYLVIILLYCPALYKMCGYSLGENVITIDKVFFIHRHTKINFSKIQYCLISQGPLQKIYGVCSVVFLTAGSSEIINDISFYNAKKIKISAEE